MPSGALMTLVRSLLSLFTRGGGVGPAAGRVAPIGLDVGLEQLNLAQCERRRDGGIALKASRVVPFSGSRAELLGSPNRLKRLMAEAMEDGGFSGRRIVASLPPADVRIFTLSYTTGGKSDAEAILGLVGNRVEGALADYVIDYLPVRASKGDEESLAVVALAKKRLVVRYLDAIAHSGFDVIALEVGPSAIKRLVSIMADDGEYRTVLVINFGRTESYLTMVSGRRLLFDQEIDFGEDILLQRVAESLKLDVDIARKMVLRHGVAKSGAAHTESDEEREIVETLAQIVRPEFQRLVDEVGRVLVYAASETRGQSVSDIFVMGSIARWPGATALLGKMLSVPVASMPSPFASARSDASATSVADEIPELAVAIGLSLREIADHA